MSIKRVCINLGLVLCLAGLIAWCVLTGKAYDIVLENTPTTVAGAEQPALEAVHVIIDKQEPVLMLEGDRIISTAIGIKHKIRIDVLDENDKVLESRSHTYIIRDLGTPPTLNIPAVFAASKAEK
jgi:hypothetical protein